MKNHSWIIKLNIMVLALILVLLFMSKAKDGAISNFMSGVFGGTPTHTPAQEAGR